MRTVWADLGDLDRLNDMIDVAVTRTAKERSVALRRTADKVESEARANAEAFHIDSTGELAAAVRQTGTDLTRFIGAAPRQAWFLEVGSPDTGAPRPWLSGPADRGAQELLAELGELADPS